MIASRFPIPLRDGPIHRAIREARLLRFASVLDGADTPPELRNRYSLSDPDVQELARYAVTIERHYGRPMDIEWGRDGIDGRLYILQARPETVKSQAQGKVEQRYKLKGDPLKVGTVLAEGRAIGQKIGTGPVRLVHNISEMDKVQPGDVLLSDMTDPNCERVMKRASAISRLTPSEEWTDLGKYADLLGDVGGNQGESVHANTQWSSPEPFDASTDGIGSFTIHPDAEPGTKVSGTLRLEFKVYAGSGDTRVKIGSFYLPLEVSVTVGAVEAMAQTITFPEIADKMITDAPFALGAQASE